MAKYIRDYIVKGLITEYKVEGEQFFKVSVIEKHLVNGELQAKTVFEKDGFESSKLASLALHSELERLEEEFQASSKAEKKTKRKTHVAAPESAAKPASGKSYGGR